MGKIPPPPPPPPCVIYLRTVIPARGGTRLDAGISSMCFTKGQGLVQKADQRTVKHPLSRRLGGFSLVGMMVGMGILSVLVLGFMEFMRGSLKGQQKLMEVREIGDLKNEMGILLDNEAHCRNSLAGPGKFRNPKPGTEFTTFKKTDIDGQGPQGDKEGREVTLWASNQDEDDRVEEENPMFTVNKQYGTLTIKSIKLLMNQKPTSNNGDYTDYSESVGHEDIGTLKVKVENLDKQEQSFNIKLSVFMKTDADGLTTLLSCSRDSSARRCGKNQKWHNQCGCVNQATLQRIIETQNNDNVDCNPITYYKSFINNQDFGEHDFCFVSKVRWRGPCRNESGMCAVKKLLDGKWQGIKTSNYRGGCGGGDCDAICLGGEDQLNCSGQGKENIGGSCQNCAPGTIADGKCRSCDPPNQHWYKPNSNSEEGWICMDCPEDQFSEKCRGCTNCPKIGNICRRWDDGDCSCVPVECPPPEPEPPGPSPE